jgi:hypothetical protein
MSRREWLEGRVRELQARIDHAEERLADLRAQLFEAEDALAEVDDEEEGDGR